MFFMLLLLPNRQCSSVPNRLTGLTVNGSSLKEEQITMTVEAMREGKAQRKTESRTCTARERERQRERERERELSGLHYIKARGGVNSWHTSLHAPTDANSVIHADGHETQKSCRKRKLFADTSIYVERKEGERERERQKKSVRDRMKAITRSP